MNNTDALAQGVLMCSRCVRSDTEVVGIARDQHSLVDLSYHLIGVGLDHELEIFAFWDEIKVLYSRS